MKHPIILILIFACLSCKKENNSKWTEVHIDIQNGISGEAVDDIYFTVYGSRTTFPSNTDNIGIAYPEDGHLEFGFIHKSSYHYFLYKEEYSKYFTQSSSGHGISVGQINHFTYNVVRYGQLKLSITNSNCFDNTDALEYRLRNTDNAEYIPDNFYWESGFTWDGCHQDFQLYDLSIPAGNYAFDWKVSRANGNNDQGSHIFFVDQDTVTTTLVNY